MHEFGQSIVRMASFTGKELREVVRRPGVLASLILGPFVIMFIFGLGYSGYREPFRTEIVIPQGNDFPRDPEYYADLAPGRLDVLNVGDDPAPAEQRLRDGDIDLLIIAPESASTELRAGRQTTIRVAWNEVDPVYHQLAGLATSILTSSLNAEIIEQAAEEGISFAEGEIGPEVSNVPPEVIARPTNAETTNVAPTEPDVLNFFGPAVFALAGGLALGEDAGELRRRAGRRLVNVAAFRCVGRAHTDGRDRPNPGLPFRRTCRQADA